MNGIKINHNPHNLEPDQKVILDKNHHDSSIVTIESLTRPNQMFANVYWFNKNNTWQVMTKRLSPIDNIN